MASVDPIPPRPESFSVAELVADALRGRLRVPPFQRSLKWDADDVSTLLDSLRRGYPIGSLLLWRGGPEAPTGPVQLGPVVIDVARTDDVRWLVDGQQRVVSLVASLTPQGASDPRFDQWFDPDDASFHRRPRRGPEPQWIEVWRLLDAADLGEFLYTWGAGTPERRRAVLDAGKRLREYRVASTVIETDDLSAVRQVFQRTNVQGKSLKAEEVFDAWAVPGGTLAELAASVAQLGWGSVDHETLLRAAWVNEGRNPTRQPTGEEVEQLGRASIRLRPALAACVAFLREDAAVPHLSLLPYNFPLQILPAFFDRHPDPTARSRTLMARWVWRMFERWTPGDLTTIRAAARTVSDPSLTEEHRLASLLAAIPTAGKSWSFEGDRFRSDSGPARIGLLALAALRPADLRTGAPIDVGRLFETESHPVAVLIDSDGRAGTPLASIANRALHPPGSDLAAEVTRWATEIDPGAGPLLSHAIDADAAEALGRGDIDSFLTSRATLITGLVAWNFDRFSGWDQDDRPNLRALP